ncbi:hypothetical protein PHYBOEH_001223 [Phytophthora boehmeriae]|uniref:Cyclic nucleotide-binding domain-containing protein n=1 Tax=Phytophthora boehmeriae TaxID=109152 RepID=A0A8T1WWK7_9STRA|nr:hypothetical protein PHYBOEH_001223 [Phytophthora boehmeriae]
MKGDVDRSMYFIAHGRILVKLDSAESVRERGEFFGELALLYGIARLETCVALTITELYRLDHEPYERLLQDFPEYRYQNRLAWTRPTGSAPDHTVLESIVRNFQKGIRRSVVSFQEPAMSIIPPLDVVANAERINTDLPHSHIYRFIMELLARLHHLSPLEARDLVVQGRTAARKHLKALLGLATSRDEKPHLEMLVPMIDTHEDVSAFQHGDEEANWDKAQDCTEPDGQPSSSSASGRRATVGAFAKQGSRLDVLNV